ncbi:MAG: tetratricopeptide repeat protein, partial [Planctomycetaceae bacterium]
MRQIIIIAFASSLQFSLSACPADAQQSPAATSPLDSVSQQASRLEAELGKFKDTSPDAANTLVQLVELYHSHGRGFGLIRSGQKFVAAHAADKRHHDVMLKLIDGLESMSRDKELVVNCRQYLVRYPQSGSHRSILERLAITLEKHGDRIGAAQAFRKRWQREANVNGRRWGARAAGHYATGKRDEIELGAALSEEMFDKLPKDQFARHIGLRAFTEWRRINDWAHSNVVGHKLLRSSAPLTASEKRFVHQYVSENSASLGQFTNAVQSLVAARAIRDDQILHAALIQRLHQAAAKAQQLEPIVQDYLRKYPTRIDRAGMQVLLAHAYIRDKNTQRALQLLDGAMAIDAAVHDAAGLYVRTCGTTPQQLAQSERALRTAISRNKNRQNAWYLRYVLAFQVYRDGLKNPARAKQVLREMFANSPPNNGNSWNALSWLLSSAENEAEFRSDVTRMITARRQNIHLGTLRNHLATWAKNARRTKELKPRAQYVTAELHKTTADPVIPLWLKMVHAAHLPAGSKLRQQLLVPALFNKQSPDQRQSLLNAEGYFLRNWGKKRDAAATVYGRLCALLPNDFPAAVAYLQTATDYAPKEVSKQAALHLLRLKPQSNDSDIWRRLFIACDKNEDDQLARRVNSWVQSATTQFGTNPTYAATIGDALLRRKMEKEAVAWWTRHMTTHREHAESRECAMRLLGRMTEPAPKIALLTELVKHDTDMHEHYAQLLAGQFLLSKDLTRFEQIMNASIQRRLQRPLRPRSLEAKHLSGLITATRGQKEWTDQEKTRVYTVIQNLKFDWPSAVASLLILEAAPNAAQNPMPRLLAYQRATRAVYNDTHRWNQLMPFAQSTMKREDYVATATLLTGMLANITNVSPANKSLARNMVSQSYARLGSVGLTIDETSPMAPLLQAALYLRLGDQQLALEAYTANQSLFDTHRDEVPQDLLLFVCQNLMAAGGNENYDKVEDILRSWLVKNSESAQVETDAKAEVQLLLARNYFSAQRFDIARSEYTTVINRYADSPFALDAQFGIGETFMAQKVYDQAEAVFEKLATSREADTVVRAEFLRGVLAHRRGDHEEARQIFRGVLERVPNVELANQALFNLAEVYGAEERYIEQLNLLQTVGRLGRTSKRRHTPGLPLSIVVQDSDLGISRGHNRIPVIIRTAPGGDEELVYLLSGGAGKGLFRIDVETQLGQVTKQDKVLQLTGNGVILCDYHQVFKAEFRSVPL